MEQRARAIREPKAQMRPSNRVAGQGGDAVQGRSGRVMWHAHDESCDGHVGS